MSKQGIDDYLAAGNTLESLVDHRAQAWPDFDTEDTRFTDAGMADGIAEYVLDGRYLWCPELGWMGWDSRRYAPRSEEHLREQVRLFIADMYREAVRSQQMPHVLKWIHALHAKSRITGIVTLARGLVEVSASDFDQDPDVLNVLNGVIDLSTGEIWPHDPARLITKLAPVNFIPGATHRDWDAALRALPEECREWFQIRLGHGLTGHAPDDDKNIVLHGGGANGKSTVVAPLRGTLGDYYLTVAHRALLADAKAHPTELMDFRGARFGVLEETPEGGHLNMVRIKMVSGTAEITARNIAKDDVTFPVTHDLYITTNYLPVVTGTVKGDWRRLALLTFPYTYLTEDEEPTGDPNERTGDPRLRERLKAGGDGRHEAVLAWLVEGARRWYQAGRKLTGIPDRVKADTRAWRKVSDILMGFIDDELEFDPDSHVISEEAYAAFVDWCKARGYTPWSLRTFVSQFAAHEEITAHRVEKKKCYRSAALSPRLWPINQPDKAMESRARQQYQGWVGLRFRAEDRAANPGRNRAAAMTPAAVIEDDWED